MVVVVEPLEVVLIGLQIGVVLYDLKLIFHAKVLQDTMESRDEQNKTIMKCVHRLAQECTVDALKSKATNRIASVFINRVETGISLLIQHPSLFLSVVRKLRFHLLLSFSLLLQQPLLFRSLLLPGLLHLQQGLFPLLLILL